MTSIKKLDSFCAFGTCVNVTLYGDVDVCDFAAELIRKRCAEYEALFSRYIEGSDIWRINNSCGSEISVDNSTFNLVGLSKYYCEASEGIFDITTGALSSLWDFKGKRIANPCDLERASCHVDWQAIRLIDDGDLRIKLDDNLAQIDLGGIAKGWIADQLVFEFSEYELRGFVLDLGGNIIVSGKNPNRGVWKIGIRDPFERSKRVASIEICGGSVVTSGIYERSFIDRGKCYHHILDPKSGMPFETDLMSATLVCDKSIDAEGYSTCALALGSAKSQEFIRAIPAIKAALLIEADGSLIFYES